MRRRGGGGGGRIFLMIFQTRVTSSQLEQQTLQSVPNAGKFHHGSISLPLLSSVSLTWAHTTHRTAPAELCSVPPDVVTGSQSGVQGAPYRSLRPEIGSSDKMFTSGALPFMADLDVTRARFAFFAALSNISKICTWVSWDQQSHCCFLPLSSVITCPPGMWHFLWWYYNVEEWLVCWFGWLVGWLAGWLPGSSLPDCWFSHCRIWWWFRSLPGWSRQIIQTETACTSIHPELIRSPLFYSIPHIYPHPPPRPLPPPPPPPLPHPGGSPGLSKVPLFKPGLGI